MVVLAATVANSAATNIELRNIKPIDIAQTLIITVFGLPFEVAVGALEVAPRTFVCRLFAAH